MTDIFTELENIDFVTAIQSLVNRSCIIDFGIVKKVVAKGIVDIAVSVADTEHNIVVSTCVLANIAGNSFTLDVEPKEGDKVIVLYPRTYDVNMFDVKKSDIIINKNTKGYSILGGIAILMNQYRKDSHNNVLHLNEKDFTFNFNDNELSLNEDSELNININGNELSLNKDSELNININENKLSLNKDSELNVNINGNKLSLNKDSELSVNVGKTNISINKNSEVTINNGNATLKLDSSGNIELNAKGKINIKNNATNLKDVIDGLAKELENLVTTGSPATQATSPASKATIATWRASKLNTLM